jgi:hypothetical protein
LSYLLTWGLLWVGKLWRKKWYCGTQIRCWADTTKRTTSIDIAMQQEDKQTPVSMQWLRYCWAITMETVFYTWSVPTCYKQDSLKEWVQLSEVMWSSWLVIERVQLSVQWIVSLWREDEEVGDKWPQAWDPVSWGLALQWSSAQEAVKKRLSCKSAAVKRRLYVWYLECVIQWDRYSSCVKSVARKWLMETVIDWEH